MQLLSIYSRNGQEMDNVGLGLGRWTLKLRAMFLQKVDEKNLIKPESLAPTTEATSQYSYRVCHVQTLLKIGDKESIIENFTLFCRWLHLIIWGVWDVWGVTYTRVKKCNGVRCFNRKCTLENDCDDDNNDNDGKWFCFVSGKFMWVSQNLPCIVLNFKFQSTFQFFRCSSFWVQLSRISLSGSSSAMQLLSVCEELDECTSKYLSSSLWCYI